MSVTYNSMLHHFKKPLAFVRRDFGDAASYKLSFLMQFAGIFISILTFFFLSRLFGGVVVSYLQPYGGDYFSFVLIGIAFSGYIGVAQHSIAGTISTAQEMGTLEALMVTQTGVPTILFSSSLSSFIWTTLRVLVYLVLGVVVFGVDMGGANIPAAILILLLSITSLGGFGIISASFIMAFKKGDPLSWVFSSLSGFLGGVIYPIEVFPGWLQTFSYLLPITHSLKGMRLALLQGYSTKALLPSILALVLFTAIMLPLSLLIFQKALRKAKMDGSLTQY
jgi:ABC-2 type transport system permease protein